MEDETPKKRNVRPVETSNLPIVTLIVLVLLVFGMLYVGYEYISDSSSNSEELTSNIDTDTGVNQAKNDTYAEDTYSPAAATITKSAIKKEEETPSIKPAPVTEAAKPEVKSVSPSSVGGKSITYTVKAGDTYTNIASKFNLKVETLKGLNSETSELKSGNTKLNIQVQALHTVGPGDVLRVVAQKYGVTKEAIMKANGKTKDFAERGEKLYIPLASKK
jgi:LysM repeat protein